MELGFLRVASVIPRTNVADCDSNTTEIIGTAISAANLGAEIILFPELSITSYTCGDLFAQELLISKSLDSLKQIRTKSCDIEGTIVVGAPILNGSLLYNCAVVISKGHILGIVPKTYLPNYKEFYEKRWFASSKSAHNKYIQIFDETVPFGTDIIFKGNNYGFAIEICEDLWAPIPPSSLAALKGANVILNLSASNELIGKHNYLLSLIKQQSARCMAAYIYSSAGFGESSTDIIFSGNAIIAENGSILAESERFSLDNQIEIADIDVSILNSDRKVVGTFGDNASDFVNEEFREIQLSESKNNSNGKYRTVNRFPFVPSDDKMLNDRCEEIINIQVEGLMRRLKFTNIAKAVIGVSGGLDSTLALLVIHRAFIRLGLDTKGIIGITMPGFGTTGRTYKNAIDLMKELNINSVEIPISKSVIQHFEDIGQDINVHDITYENGQARERTQILMDYANKCGGLVIGTGDMSELALGWATYNGDHMSMYGVNASIPKTLVKYLVRWFALNGEDEVKKTLLDIVDTPISPELIPAYKNGEIKQKTEDLVGPYELHDFFLYYILRYGFSPVKIYYLAKMAFKDFYEEDVIKKWMKTFYRRFFQQQFKRSCLPDGPKVGSVSLSPRGDWRMPSDACAHLWLSECDKL